ncbi:TPA: CapA family protein [Clostridium perfringens]|uniref:CapA family protein n=1 Tax=Clostridium TaxID=1485 RepID=UPI000D71B38B|nr:MULTISPECIES: CapA family protein [Clostridium]MBO3403173.1 CapA family protein [Clostridium perfringens]MDK0875071.1 CapA family protein [Clostridium perfringens]PWW88085.1 capsule biosynthesis protein CapA [Clostridium perfringens]PWX34980.1 capsule biosynthesis protein CapA [Clostridium perfringens]USQ65253.1 CapA family protein [Clostridium sp. 16K-1-R1]
MIRMSKKIKVILASLLIVCSVLVINSIISNNVVTTKGASIDEKEVIKENDKKGFFNRFSLGRKVNISAVGDIILHDEQIWSAYNEENKAYDFMNNFKYVKNFIEKSDIAYGTIEGTYAGEEIGYSGYPNYNGPDSMIDALKDTGFDIINVATDHSLDKGVEGASKTGEKIDKDMTSIGNKKYIIKKVKGIEIGFTSYTYESKEGELNGHKIPEDMNLNTFSYNKLDNGLEEMKALVEEMKNEGAEFIVFGMHWGVEYKTEPSKYQVKIAEALNEYGVDLILGSNPHVVQPIEEIEGENGNKTLVAYSLGNFISNQRLETMGDRRTADGVILNLTLDKSRKGVKIEKWDYTPTWVYKIPRENKKSDYYILPVEETLNSEEGKKLDQETLNQLNKSLEATKSIVEK